MKKRKKKDRSKKARMGVRGSLEAKLERLRAIERGERKETAADRKEMDEFRSEVLRAAVVLTATTFVFRIAGGLEQGERYDFKTANELGQEFASVMVDSLQLVGPSVLMRQASGDEKVMAPLAVPASWGPLVSAGMAKFGVKSLSEEAVDITTH